MLCWESSWELSWIEWGRDSSSISSVEFIYEWRVWDERQGTLRESCALEMNLYLFQLLCCCCSWCCYYYYYLRIYRHGKWMKVVASTSTHLKFLHSFPSKKESVCIYLNEKRKEIKKGYKVRNGNVSPFDLFFHLLSFQIIWTLESISVLCSRNIISSFFLYFLLFKALHFHVSCRCWSFFNSLFSIILVIKICFTQFLFTQNIQHSSSFLLFFPSTLIIYPNMGGHLLSISLHKCR
jgi:hypothetical protein